MVGVLEKLAQHRTTDDADDNVAQWGSGVINYMVTEDNVAQHGSWAINYTRAPWLAAGADRVLWGITAGTSGPSRGAKSNARNALSALDV